MKLTAHHRRYTTGKLTLILMTKHREEIEELVKEVKKAWLTFPGILKPSKLAAKLLLKVRGIYWPRWVAWCRDGHIHSLIARNWFFRRFRWSPQAKKYKEVLRNSMCWATWASPLLARSLGFMEWCHSSLVVFLRRYIPIVTVEW